MYYDLKENEEIKSLNRKHILTFGWQFFISLVLIITPFFFMVPLWKLGAWGYVIFGVLVGSGIILWFRAYFNWHSNILMITDERLIIVERQGFLRQKVSKIGYEQIRSVEVIIRGVFQTLFKCGTLEIRLIESPTPIEFTNLCRPTLAQELILNLSKEHKQTDSLGQMDYFALIETARKIRDKIGQGKFKEIAEE